MHSILTYWAPLAIAGVLAVGALRWLAFRLEGQSLTRRQLLVFAAVLAAIAVALLSGPVVALVLLGVVALYLVAVAWVQIALATLRRRILASIGTFAVLDPIEIDRAPDSVARIVQAFARRGFEEILTVRIRDGGTVIALLRRVDAVIAEISLGPELNEEPPIIHVTSVLAEGHAMLQTKTHAWGLVVRPGEFRQVFPEAEPAELLARHERARSHLAAHGLHPMPLGRQSPSAFWERHLDYYRSLFRTMPNVHLATELRRLRRDPESFHRPIMEHPATPELVEEVHSRRASNDYVKT